MLRAARTSGEWRADRIILVQDFHAPRLKNVVSSIHQFTSRLITFVDAADTAALS